MSHCQPSTLGTARLQVVEIFCPTLLPWKLNKTIQLPILGFFISIVGVSSEICYAAVVLDCSYAFRSLARYE